MAVFAPWLSLLGVTYHHHLQGEKWSVKIAYHGFWLMLPPLFISHSLEKEFKSVVGFNNTSWRGKK